MENWKVFSYHWKEKSPFWKVNGEPESNSDKLKSKKGKLERKSYEKESKYTKLVKCSILPPFEKPKINIIKTQNSL